MHRRSLARLLGLVLTFLLLLVACGDDGDTGSTDSSDADASTDSDNDSDSDSDDDSSDDREDGDSSESAGACDLLTTDEVAELLGQAVEDGEQEDLGEEGATTCEWATEELSQSVDSPITLDVELGPLTDEISGQIDEALAIEANEPLDIGDRAVLVCGLGADGADCTSYDSVAVAVGDQYLEVDLGNWGYPDDFSEDEGVQITVDAAQRAVDALA